MTAPPSQVTEQAIARSGDQLYRLALLLTNTLPEADATLRTLLRRLGQQADADTSEPTLVRTLLQLLPAEPSRPSRQSPTWTVSANPEATARLLQISQLPRAQRCVLALRLLFGYDHQLAAETLGISQDELAAQFHAALSALAPTFLGQPDDPLPLETVSAACVGTRQALLNGTTAPLEVRQHLAHCSACRSAEQRWTRLERLVEETLRGTLRPFQLPEYVLNSALQASPRERISAWLHTQTGRWTIRAAVPLAVLLVLVLVVLPALNAHPTPAAEIASNTDPRQLVQQARDSLYVPAAGDGIWHGVWQIRWTFTDGSSANLNAEIWRDAANQRHRVQLVHEAGGGPYEFEIANGSDNVWYALDPKYAASLEPQLVSDEVRAVRAVAPREQQQALLTSRLQTGAWSIADTYLRQALATPNLRSWGQQTADDGQKLEIISYQGSSPLGPPADAWQSEGITATILLAIARDSGQLYSVNELVGPSNGEQVSRTTWQFVRQEYLVDNNYQRSTIFNAIRSFRGTSEFVARQQLGDTLLPLLDPALLITPEQLLEPSDPSSPSLMLPSQPPTDAIYALLLRNDNGTMISYIGERGRRLTISSQPRNVENNEDFVNLPTDEFTSIAGLSARLRPGPAQSYLIELNLIPNQRRLVEVIRITAHGYNRTELLSILSSLEPASRSLLQQQAALFSHDSTTP